jgi:hypothetical protein
LKLTKDELTEAVISIFTRLAEGQTDVEVADGMGLTTAEYQKLKTAMFEFKSNEIRKKPREHVYVEYVIEQMQNIKALSNIIDKYDTEGSKQYTAIVGAIRTKAELSKSLLQMGQEFGIIHKEPDKKEFIAGVMVSELTNEDLKKMVLKELKSLNESYKTFSSKGLEVPSEIYFEGDGTKDEPLQVEGKTVEVEKTKKKKVEAKPKKRNVKRTKVKTKHDKTPLSPLDKALKNLED